MSIGSNTGVSCQLSHSEVDNPWGVIDFTFTFHLHPGKIQNLLVRTLQSRPV